MSDATKHEGGDVATEATKAEAAKRPVVTVGYLSVGPSVLGDYLNHTKAREEMASKAGKASQPAVGDQAAFSRIVGEIAACREELRGVETEVKEAESIATSQMTPDKRREAIKVCAAMMMVIEAYDELTGGG